MNTAAGIASAVASVVFGYMVGYFGNYNTPFIPMVALLSLGRCCGCGWTRRANCFHKRFPMNS